MQSEIDIWLAPGSFPYNLSTLSHKIAKELAISAPTSVTLLSGSPFILAI